MKRTRKSTLFVALLLLFALITAACGGDDDDVLLGGPGFDTLDGGAGDDTLIDGEVVTDGLVAGQEWLAAHTRVVNGKTVLDAPSKSYTVPAAVLAMPAAAS